MSQTTDPREVKRQEQREKALGFRQAQDFRDALSRAPTRRILHSILVACDIYEDIPPGTAESHARLGMRRVGLALRQKIKEIDRRALSVMENEWEADPEVPSAGVDDEPGGVEAEL